MRRDRRAPRRPAPREVRLGLGARVGLAAADHDLGAAAHEALGDGPADAPGPAGDDRDAVAHVEQRLELSPCPSREPNAQPSRLAELGSNHASGRSSASPAPCAAVEHELGPGGRSAIRPTRSSRRLRRSGESRAACRSPTGIGPRVRFRRSAGCISGLPSIGHTMFARTPRLRFSSADDLREPTQRELRRGVRARERRALHRVDRADVHDRARARRRAATAGTCASRGTGRARSPA